MLNQPHILVATDFSEGSDHALRAGERLRSLSKGTLKVIHATSLPNEWDWFTNDVTINYLPTTFKKELVENLQKKMDQQVKRCEVKAETELIFGTPSKVIKEYSEKEKVDLIITGHKGSGATHELMGSITTKLVSTSNVPVLVVNKPLNMSKVAGLIDASKPLEQIFSASEEFGFLLGAQILFVSVFPNIGAIGLENFSVKTKISTRFTEEEISQIKNEMEKCIRLYMDTHSKAQIRTEICEGTISGALNKILNEEAVDLAVLCRNQRNLIEKIFIGSVSRRILETYAGNILVLPPVESHVS